MNRTILPFTLALSVAAVAITACSGQVSSAGEEEADGEVGVATQGVIAGGTEPDFKFPWMVRKTDSGCGGVMISPRWVLTAAHCVANPTLSTGWLYRRTDPYTGAESTETRKLAVDGSGSTFGATHLHPAYDPRSGSNDVALVKLDRAFAVTPQLQTVALPRTPLPVGLQGTVASINQKAALAAGTVAVFRGPIQDVSHAGSFTIAASPSTTGYLCPGDSGSGFVTYEGSRAVVRGVAFEGTSNPDCVVPSGPYEQDFVDVFAYRDWILGTIGESDDSLAGSTRVRMSGRGARGQMGIGCTNPYGTQWGPLYVPGAELGANCEPGDTMTALCSMNDSSNPLIGFTMRTTYPNGTVQTQSLPYGPSFAAYYGVAPSGVVREFLCHTKLVAFPIDRVPVLTRSAFTP